MLIIKIHAKIILTIVGFMYKKMGLSKYKVKPPKSDMIIPPISGTYGIFFSIMYIITTAIIVAIIRGGMAAVRLFPLL